MSTELQDRPATFSQPSLPDRHKVAGLAQHGVAVPREFLSFRLGNQEYGIDIMRVQEIRSYEPTTRIANAPEFIKGVVNLRGVIVPVVDMRLKLDCNSAEYNHFTAVIVLNIRGRVVGAVVDSVSDVLQLASDSIKPAPELSSAIDTKYILGIGCIKSDDDERMLILCDIESLLCGAELGIFGGDAI